MNPNHSLVLFAVLRQKAAEFPPRVLNIRHKAHPTPHQETVYWGVHQNPTLNSIEPLVTFLAKSNLRFQIISPIIAVAAIASLLVAFSSWTIGQNRSQTELLQRFSGIKRTVNKANYPLTKSVTASLAELTETQWILVGKDGELISSTIDFPPSQWSEPQWRQDFDELLSRLVETKLVDQPTRFLHTPVLKNQTWLAASFKRQSNGLGSGTDLWVVILFDHEKLSASSWRAALLPLLTGLSTIAAVTLVMLVASSRIINRIRRLQTQVEVIASGNFEARLANPSNDELGKLSDSINRMAEQLRQLWNQIHQQQRSRLLHQMASGISHQLRNTLTGARMAMELHAKSCVSDRIDEVHVALRQLEIAENYVKRITVVGSGEQQPAEPKSIADCLKEIQATHRGVAEHLQVDLSWEFESPPLDQYVDNGSLFVAAISNLLLNAIQASSRVFVRGKISHNQLVEIEVIDEGSGIPPDLQDEVFQPFYTTKPEGMGLGLAMVKQIAEQLGGKIIYDRRDDQSIFRFQCKTHQVTQRIKREHE